jgi:hypothetical protein
MYMRRSGPLTWLMTGIALAIFAVGYIIGKVVWWTLKGLWFVFAILPARIVHNTCYNIRARQLERAALRLGAYEQMKELNG